LKENEDRLIDLLGDRPYHQIEGVSHEVELDGYGYRWFRIGGYHL
ncbi:MAG: hypothetical protein HC878_10465, partial [Leptolyngbyaceae cyanobacterium SL_5_14]|nr:hypothetical protein [Leptolyngbyaceae cyanobacterium SL_5_14]